MNAVASLVTEEYASPIASDLAPAPSFRNASPVLAAPSFCASKANGLSKSNIVIIESFFIT
jgi:hypothetical protein